MNAMRLRRANRAIETFDISLMAVVTKAMGAFLVLMLLLVPSYVAMPAMQRQLANDEAASRALEQTAASLVNENRALEAAQADRSRQEQLRQRIAALEQENKQLAQRPGYPALLVFFDWNECSADNVDFYVAADSPGWPDVRPGPQPLPPGVFEYPQAQLAQLLLDLIDPGSTLTDFGTRRAAKHRLWIIETVRPNSSYSLYAKVGSLSGDCDISTNTLLTKVDFSDRRSSGGTVIGLSSKPTPGLLSNKGHRIVFLDRLHWDGKTLDEHTWLENPHEQQKLDARFGHD